MDNIEDDSQELEESLQQTEDIENDQSLPQNNEVEMELDTKNKSATLTGSKKLIALLMKKKMLAFAAIIGVVLILMIIIIAIVTGSESTNYIYKESTCKNVTIKYDPYGEESETEEVMELEQYVKSALYAYTKDMQSPPSGIYHVYFSLAVALRNEVITNDCEITYRDKKLEASIPADEYRDRALKNAEGITIVDNNEEFIPVKVTDFSWSSENDESYTIFQTENLKVKKEFTDFYLKNEVYRNCETNKYTEIEIVDEDDGDICWTYWENEVDEKTGEVINYKREYLHQDEKTGYNLYGAYYLLVQFGKLYDDQVRYFLGSDVQYRTINKDKVKKEEIIGSANNSNCMWWPIGSDETTEVNGILLASGEPYTIKITSPYGYRDSPTAGASSNHKAIDIGGGVKGVTNIIAASSGIVIKANTGCIEGNKSCGGQLGNYVKIQHKDGTISRYGHMESLSVVEGDDVLQGQVIGKMGSTGTSTGTHLDFQILVNGSTVNPINYVDPKNPRKKCTTISGGSNNQQTVCLNLIEQGKEYSKNALTGIMANIQAESNFNPNALNKGSGAFGLVQWLGGRKTGVKNACDQFTTIDELISCQITYTFQELNSSEISAKKYLLGNDSASQMAYNVCMYYERPGKAICESGLRQEYANKLFSYIENDCA